MVTSFQLWPPSCVTKTPFHTQLAEDAGLRSLAATRTFFGSVGLAAAHISCFGPALWLGRAPQSWPQDALRARSYEPSLQSSCQPDSAGWAAMAASWATSASCGG